MGATTSTTSQPGEKGERQRGAVDRDLYCARLDAYLGGAAAAHGLRGTLASVTASIERGGVGGGGEDPNVMMLQRIGYLHSGAGIGQHRESERRFRLLSAKHQGKHLAHYLGTSRCHATLRATFGDLDGGGVAGVVLERWLAKKAKERARGADGAVQVTLERVRAELGPLELAIVEARAVLDTPSPPLLPAVEGQRPDRAPQRKHRQKRQDAEQSLWLSQEAALPLQDQRARLCAQLAAIAAGGSAADDEQALVDLCRNGLAQAAKDAMVDAATADVRAAHRAWRETGKKVAAAWLDEGTEAEPAA